LLFLSSLTHIIAININPDSTLYTRITSYHLIKMNITGQNQALF